MAAKPTSTAAAQSAISQNLQSQKQTAIEQHEKRIEEVLSYPILLSDQINHAVKEAGIFKLECSEVGKQVERLCQMLRSAVRLATSTTHGATFYVRPARRIATEVSKHLEKSLTLVKKCRRRRNPLRRVVTIVSGADFKKLHILLDNSVADMKWVLSIYEAGGAGGGIVLTLPPIASNDPMISWVWSFVSSLHMAQLPDKIEAAAKAVVDQLLRLIKDSEDSQLSIAALCAIGCLARAFPARETRVIVPLVEQLGHRSQEVATEAAIALGKFTCPDNFLCAEHSKTIIEFRGVPPLMRLLKGSERAQLHGLILICYLAIHAGKSDDLERAGVVNAFEGVDRAFVAQHPELKELITQALYHLSVFHQSHSGMLAQRPYLAP